MADEIYNRVGGRLSFLKIRVAKSQDMLSTCDEILDVEKKWFLNQCWILGEEMDDDVMDQQKFAVSKYLSTLARGSCLQLMWARANTPPCSLDARAGLEWPSCSGEQARVFGSLY